MYAATYQRLPRPERSSPTETSPRTTPDHEMHTLRGRSICGHTPPTDCFAVSDTHTPHNPPINNLVHSPMKRRCGSHVSLLLYSTPLRAWSQRAYSTPAEYPVSKVRCAILSCILPSSAYFQSICDSFPMQSIDYFIVLLHPHCRIVRYECRVIV